MAGPLSSGLPSGPSTRVFLDAQRQTTLGNDHGTLLATSAAFARSRTGEILEGSSVAWSGDLSKLSAARGALKWEWATTLSEFVT